MERDSSRWVGARRGAPGEPQAASPLLDRRVFFYVGAGAGGTAWGWGDTNPQSAITDSTAENIGVAWQLAMAIRIGNYVLCSQGPGNTWAHNQILSLELNELLLSFWLQNPHRSPKWLQREHSGSVHIFLSPSIPLCGPNPLLQTPSTTSVIFFDLQHGAGPI
jgi:hypothetical protein